MKDVFSWMYFSTISYAVGIERCSDESFCLLASVKLVVTPDRCLLYLHSSDVNSLKSYTL